MRVSKQFWAVVVIVVLALVGVFVLTGNNNGGSGGNATLTNHLEGQGQSGVTLIEYGDYQCPACGAYYPTLKQVEQQYASAIHFQFRNFPLTSLHPNAFAGARAAEAAALQGKFWQMHDKLYDENDLYYAAQEQHQTYNTWINASDPLSYFSQYAQSLGLNVTQFKNDFASDKVNATVNADLGEANKLGLSATPSFILDGKQVQITNTAADFQKVLNAEIKAKGGTPPSSTDTTAPAAESTTQTQQ